MGVVLDLANDTITLPGTEMLNHPVKSSDAGHPMIKINEQGRGRKDVPSKFRQVEVVHLATADEEEVFFNKALMMTLKKGARMRLRQAWRRSWRSLRR